jgi:hypothetical protein
MKMRFNPLRDMLLFIVLSSLLLYTLMVFTQNRQQAGNDLEAFDKADLKGKIVEKQLRSGNELIRVDNSLQLYHFRPLVSAEGSFFHANTEVGDSIIKPPFSTTITVKSGTETYQYAFER